MHFLRSKMVRQLLIPTMAMLLLSKAAVLISASKWIDSRYEISEEALNEEMAQLGLSKEDTARLQTFNKKRRSDTKQQSMILLLTLISFSSILTIPLALYVFHRKIGAPLLLLSEINRETHQASPVHFPKDQIPSNEIGELIDSRETMLRKIASYRNDLESDLKTTKSQMTQAAKMSLVGELTAMIVHDINNPLTTVKSYSNLMADETNQFFQIDEKGREIAKKIILAAERIETLVQRMGKFSRSQDEMKSGNSVIESIDNAVMFISKKALKSQVSIAKPIDNTMNSAFKFWGNPASLEQVLVNLMSNAIDAMENSEVRILTVTAAERIDGFIEIKVGDSGAGIPEDKLDKIFNSFYTTKISGKGTGLGLSSCKYIMTQHFGQIELESALGKGTTFTLLLNQNNPTANRTDVKESA